uniref:Cytoplasmic aconitate hydratase n=1 Tax=Parascaris univalens TaxID=6257 RepID=A0A914ZE16_PARUN
MDCESFDGIRKYLRVDGCFYTIWDMKLLNDPRYDELPISIRYLLESAIRNYDGFVFGKDQVEAILDWSCTQKKNIEIPFKPGRVLLQDFTGVPALVDLAAMRDAMKSLGADPNRINPVCPVDLVIDHSIQVDTYGRIDALTRNSEKEFERNHERFTFLKWGAKSFKDLRVIPPGSGIVHQVNLEYLSRGILVKDSCVFPDSVVGTDSHTTMNNGSGVLAWGVGGIEAEAVMLGQPITMVVPEVVGYRLTGSLPPAATSTDLVLTITQNLRKFGVIGKFVEFFGPGVATLSIADRATVANMCPEYGATVGFFPVDQRTIEFMRQTGRSEHLIMVLEAYMKEVGLFVDYNDTTFAPKYSEVVELNLGSIVPCLAGPKRPHDRVELFSLHTDFRNGLTDKISFKGFGLLPKAAKKEVPIRVNGQEVILRHGSVVISAVTSCTNTSNPSVMLAAGLVARNAVELGLKVPAYVKTSLSPGSAVVTKYLEASGLLPDLQKLGYHVTGYGCMTCIGNSGPLHEEVSKAIEDNDLVVAAVLSGNRNFEGRIHSSVRANYLASPPLVIIYGLTGRVDIDLQKEPIGIASNGKEIFFHDIWPSRAEVAEVEQSYAILKFFKEIYANIQKGSERWQELECPSDQLYPWDSKSTYIQKVPFFDGMQLEASPIKPIEDAYALLSLGDSVTTDHISPAGAISRVSPAARYLISLGVPPSEFNTYGSRRGNDKVMVRGTFANIRLTNKLLSRVAPRTIHIPSGDEMDVYDAAERYRKENKPVIILAGKEYGCGSSRDWAAKGPFLQGVRAVIAESYERIHRSNLIGMGIAALQYLPGQNAESLQLTGKERFTIKIPPDIKPGAKISVEVQGGKRFEVLCRLDTAMEVAYFRNGGVLPYVVRIMATD